MTWPNISATTVFGTIVLVGSFAVLGVMTVQKILPVDQTLPLLGTWIGAIITGFLVNKANNDAAVRRNQDNQPKAG